MPSFCLTWIYMQIQYTKNKTTSQICTQSTLYKWLQHKSLCIHKWLQHKSLCIHILHKPNTILLRYLLWIDATQWCPLPCVFSVAKKGQKANILCMNVRGWTIGGKGSIILSSTLTLAGPYSCLWVSVYGCKVVLVHDWQKITDYVCMSGQAHIRAHAYISNIHECAESLGFRSETSRGIYRHNIMYVCMYVYTYTYTCISIQMRTGMVKLGLMNKTKRNPCMYVCMCICVYRCVCLWACKFVYARMHMYIHLCMCACMDHVSKQVCVCVCVFAWMLVLVEAFSQPVSKNCHTYKGLWKYTRVCKRLIWTYMCSCVKLQLKIYAKATSSTTRNFVQSKSDMVIAKS